jgi:hypothetical protein
MLPKFHVAPDYRKITERWQKAIAKIIRPEKISNWSQSPIFRPPFLRRIWDTSQ